MLVSLFNLRLLFKKKKVSLYKYPLGFSFVCMLSISTNKMKQKGNRMILRKTKSFRPRKLLCQYQIKLIKENLDLLQMRDGVQLAKNNKI